MVTAGAAPAGAQRQRDVRQPRAEPRRSRPERGAGPGAAVRWPAFSVGCKGMRGGRAWQPVGCVCRGCRRCSHRQPPGQV